MTRRRLVRLAIAAIVFLAALGGLLVIGLSGGLFQEQLRVRAERLLRQATGRPVRIERVALRLHDGAVELTGLRVDHHQPDQPEPPLFIAEAVQIRWQWRPLLSRRIVLDEIRVMRPELRLSFASREASPSPAPDVSRFPFFPQTTSSAFGFELSLSRVRLQEGTVAWTEPDGRAGKLDRLDGEIAWASGKGGLQVFLEGARLAIPLGPDLHLLERPRLRAEATPQTITIGEFSGILLGFPLKVTGRLSDLDTAPRLDLQAAGEMTLAEIARLAGTPRAPEGRLALRARIQGAWANPTAAGTGVLHFGPTVSGTPLDFRFRWADGRIRAETTGIGRPAADAGTLLVEFTPVTRAFRARLKVGGLDLQAIRGIPATLAALAGVTVPPEARGRVTASVDLSGQGTDLGTLRGQATLTVDGFAWGEDSPTGRLSTRLQATSARLSFDDIAFSLPGGDVRGRGTFVPETGALDFPIRLDVRDATQFAQAFGVAGAGGTGRLDGRISGTREAPRFQGRIVWRKPRMGDLALDHLEGALAFGGRELSTPDLVLRLGQTSATVRGTLTATGAAPIRELDLKRDLAVDLAFDAEGRTADLARFLPAGLKISGAGRASGRLSGTPTALSGEAALSLQDLDTWGEAWQRGEGTLRFRPGTLQVSAITLQRRAERVTGEVAATPDGQLRGQLSSTPMDLSRISWLSGLGLTGRAAFQIDLQGTGDALRVGGKATAETLAFQTFEIGPSAATFTVGHGATDLRLEFQGGTHLLHLSTTPKPDPTLQAELRLQKASLDLLLRAAKAPVPAGLAVQGDGVLRFRGPLGDLTRGTAEAEFSRLRVQLKEELLESRGPLRLGWRDDTLTVQPARFRARGGELQVQGTVSRDGQGDLQLAGTLPLAALSGAVPGLRVTAGSATLDLRLRGALGSPVAEGEIIVTNGTVVIPQIPAPLTKLSATFYLTRDAVRISGVQGELAGGSVSGGGEVRRRAESSRFAFEYALHEARAEEVFFDPFAGRTGALTGTLSSAGRLSGEGGDTAALRRSLTGDAHLELRDGRFGQYTLLAKVLTLTDISLLFLPDSLDLRGKGMPYRRFTGDLQIRNGIVRSENILLESPALRASAVGQFDLAEETLDVTMAIRPFQTLDAVLSKIPVAGWILRGKDGNLVVAYARASGSIQDPKIEALPLKSIGGSLFGKLRERLDLPEGSGAPDDSRSPEPEGKERLDH